MANRWRFDATKWQGRGGKRDADGRPARDRRRKQKGKRRDRG